MEWETGTKKKKKIDRYILDRVREQINRHTDTLHCSLSLSRTHTHTHTHTYTQQHKKHKANETRPHHTHTTHHTHTYIHTCRHIRTHTHTHTCRHIRIHSYCIHTFAFISISRLPWKLCLSLFSSTLPALPRPCSVSPILFISC